MGIIFSEADRNFNPDKLDSKARAVWEASQTANDPNYLPDEKLKDIIYDEDRAKYKIEIVFPPRRKRNEAIACAITTFKSGGKLHGGGDELLYVCRNEKDATIGCGSVLKDPPLLGMVDGGYITVYYCAKCNKHVNRELLASTFLYKLPVKTLAQNVYKFFRQLDSNADIYLKHMKVDIREAAKIGGDKMINVPQKMEYSIYTLKSIVKDAFTEGQIVKNITNFLTV
jgi:hypothetical protein